MEIAALRAALAELARLLDQRAEKAEAGRQPGPAARERLRQLRQHVHEYLLPRVRHLDAPLVAVIIGSTGAGKSSLINALAKARVSPSGILRPTTRRPVAVATAADAQALASGELLPGLSARQALEIAILEHGGRAGVVIVDAPDVDSVEAENRAIAAELLEAADLCIVVTTAARYADQVPWQVLDRARERRLPLLAVINRLPDDDHDAQAVLSDYRRMLSRAGLAAVDSGAGTDGDLEVVAIREGAIDQGLDALQAPAVRRITAVLDRLASSRRRRQELARRSLHGALRGVTASIEAVARDVDAESATADRLRTASLEAYREETERLIKTVQQGGFLRTEVLRQWQEFVGAGQVARVLASGMGRVTAAVASFFRPPSAAPTEAVEAAAFSDLTALAVGHAHEAALRAAHSWSSAPLGSALLTDHSDLWANAPEFEDGLRAALEGWIGEIAALIGREGQARRGMARAASLGVNVLGVGVMLAAFGTTGGLTGAEFAIAGATAVLNQKLLEAIFGEATVRNLVTFARTRLAELLQAAMEQDRSRFDRALESALPDPGLADELRAVSERLATAIA